MAKLISQIRELVAKAANVEPEKVTLEHPDLEQFGDFSTNIALAAKGGRVLAEEIAQKLQGNELIEKAEVAGPGFVNISINNDCLISQIERLIKSGLTYGNMTGCKAVVEYTDPNPFKEFHIGHLMTNVTGEAIARIFEANGATVWRADYFGDVGIHVAKSIWGLKKMLKEDGISLEELGKKPLLERVNYMGKAYALGSKSADDETIKAEIAHLNTVLYVAAQRMWKAEGVVPTIDYEQVNKIPQNEIDDVYELYVKGRSWSLEYFETIYKRLGTKFDGYYPESKVAETGYKIVKENIGKVFVESEGAVIFPGEDYNLHTRVFINKHNLPTYEAKELGLAPIKYQDFAYNKSVMVVGKEIKEYFAVLVQAMKLINPALGNVTTPVCTGMVMLPEGKMGSRFGNVVTVTKLLETLKELVKQRMASQEYSEEQKGEIAEKVAVGALKYAFLKVTVGQDFVFDLEKSLSLDGNSGPYLQYTYARTKSVMRKSARVEGYKLASNYQMNAEEKAVARWIYRLEEVAEEAAERMAPNLVANFIYELAQRYNTFYNKHSILSADTKEQKESRLFLTEATGTAIKLGLNMLGIEALETM